MFCIRKLESLDYRILCFCVPKFLRLVTDRRTDRRTDDNSIYRASIASRGKTVPKSGLLYFFADYGKFPVLGVDAGLC